MLSVDRPRIWGDSLGKVVIVVTPQEPGLKIIARNGDTGEYLWDRYIERPDRKEWLRINDTVWSHLINGDVYSACVCTSTEHFGLCIHLSGEIDATLAEPLIDPVYGSWWNSPGFVKVHCFEPATGHQRWAKEIDHCPESSCDFDFFGYCRGHLNYSILDWTTGETRKLAETKSTWRTESVRFGEDVMFAWQDRGNAFIRVHDRLSGDLKKQFKVKCRKPRKYFILRGWLKNPILQLDTEFALPFTADLNPTQWIKMKGYGWTETESEDGGIEFICPRHGKIVVTGAGEVTH